MLIAPSRGWWAPVRLENGQVVAACRPLVPDVAWDSDMVQTSEMSTAVDQPERAELVLHAVATQIHELIGN